MSGPEPHVPRRYEIETASGQYVDVFMPKPETIRLEDIAHALAHTCRFGGHTSRFYSVAEHAVIVSRKVAEHDPALALAALHHDDHEAYVGDIPRPIKLLLTEEMGDPDHFEWCEVEADLDRAIQRALAWDDDLWFTSDFERPLIKDADLWALMCEAYALLPSRGEGWIVHGAPPLRWPLDDLSLGQKTPDVARQDWLDEHARLVAAVS